MRRNSRINLQRLDIARRPRDMNVPALGITVTEAAEQLGVARVTLSLRIPVNVTADSADRDRSLMRGALVRVD